jgi:hypothetical protein
MLVAVADQMTMLVTHLVEAQVVLGVVVEEIINRQVQVLVNQIQEEVPVVVLEMLVEQLGNLEDLV